MPGQIIIKWLKTSDKKKVLKATKVKIKKKTRDTQTEKRQSDSRFPVRKNATGKTVQWYVQSTEVRNKPTYLECYPQRKSVWKIIKTKIFFPPWWLKLKCRRPGFNPWVGKIPWKRKWQPTSVLLPGELHGKSGLAGSCPWGHKGSDTTDQLTHTQTYKDHKNSITKQLNWKSSNICKLKQKCF